MDAWVQLWHNGTLRFNKEKDKEQDAAEFSFAVTNLEDAGTYQCRYQVSEPLWTSNQSDPVELVLTDSVMMEVTPTHGTPVRSETPFVGPQCQPWVELSRHPCPVMGTPKPSEPTGAKRWSYVNLLVVVVKVCSALLALSSGLYFYFIGCSLWKRRNESAGVSPEMPESVQFQGFPTNNEDLTYAEMPAAIPCPQPPTYPTAPQSPVIYTTVSTDLPC
ncbi:uncharacterized protein LOC112531128 isoform X3 [Gallus gallus]|nr:uncharacterized protein LOC112531128 isoform X3 [Gallus gallus]